MMPQDAAEAGGAAILPRAGRPEEAGFSGAALALPNDGLENPDDLQRLLDGRLAQARPREGRQPALASGRGRLVGPAGFILD